MELTKKDLEKLIDSVTTDLSGILESEKLSKADPGVETPGEKTPEGSSADVPPEESASPSGEEGGEGAPAGVEDGAPAEGAPDAAPEGAPEGQPGEEGQTDPAADAQGTGEALVAEYSKLPPEELKMHFLACKEALMQSLGGDGQGNEAPPEGQPAGGESACPTCGAPTEAPPQEQAPTGDASAAPMEPGMGKSEFDSPETGSKGAEVTEGKMSKSEFDPAALMAEVEVLKKGLKEKEIHIQQMEESFGQAAIGLKKLFERGTGLRKSIASVAFTPKPGSEAASTDKLDVKSMSRTEVLGRLKSVTATNTSLKKSDRDQINAYVFGTDSSVAKIEKYLQ
jgi:hypothetical protein